MMPTPTSWPVLGKLGLSFTLRGGSSSFGIAIGAGLAFGTWMALADATVLRSAVPAVQHWMVSNLGTGERIALAWRGALLDEIVLRLGVVTAAAWLARAAFGLTGWRAWSPAILLAAFVAWPLWAHPYIAALDGSTLTVVREIVLHGAAGTLWGWLYCRHGWLAGLVGHWAAHLALQPLLALVG
jgi:hypothetical protein